MPLGIEPEAHYEQHTVNVRPGDLILFYTDGVTEAMNASGESFETERLERILISNCNVSAGELLSALESELGSFVGTEEQSDDVTMLAVKRR
jgi:sigma-B regulation protein RsbU (phosphoserine phosphatase)